MTFKTLAIYTLTSIVICTHANAQKALSISPEQRSDSLTHAATQLLDLAPGTVAGTIETSGAMFPDDATIECNYKPHKKSGTTPKFSCDVISATDRHGIPIATHGEKLKVRYSGVKIYTMVIATRLARALGFGSDIETPIRKVICHGCGDDPYFHSEEFDGTTEFDNVSIEQAMPYPELYSEGKHYFRQGSSTDPAWYWKELPSSPQADALKLFAVLLKDNDTKAVQNRLICLTALDNGTCPDPFIYVHDFGHSLGSDGHFIHPLNLEKWNKSKIWKNENSCKTRLKEDWFNGSGLSNPDISEAGRQLLATRLQVLVDHPDRVRTIFASAHIEEYYDHGQYNDADAWTEVFLEKANQIIEHSCAE